MNKLFKVLITIIYLSTSQNYLFAGFVGGGGTAGALTASDLDEIVVTKKIKNVDTTITSFTLSGTQASITISDIPATYDHLKIVFNARTDRSAQTFDTIAMSFNNDTTDANYLRTYSYIDTVNVAAVNEAADRQIGMATAASSVTGDMAVNEIIILDYASTSIQKTVKNECSMRFDASILDYRAFVLNWENTSAISRIDITSQTSSNFTAGTRIDVYGVSDESIVTDVTGSIASQASDFIDGGNTATATLVLGTNNAYGLQLKTNNTVVQDIDSSGSSVFYGDITITSTNNLSIGNPGENLNLLATSTESRFSIGSTQFMSFGYGAENNINMNIPVDFFIGAAILGGSLYIGDNDQVDISYSSTASSLLVTGTDVTFSNNVNVEGGLLNVIDGSNGGFIEIEDSDTTIGASEVIGAIEFVTNDGSVRGDGARIDAYGVDALGTTYALRFYTDSSTPTNASTARVWITPTGKVGIGDSAPDEFLDVNGVGKFDGVVNEGVLNNTGTVSVTGNVDISGGIALAGTSTYIKSVVLAIGDWNMDASATTLVAHGLSSFAPISVTGFIVNDTGGTFRAIGGYTASSAGVPVDLGVSSIDATNVYLSRGSATDSTSYDSTSYNRGYIVLWYIDV